MALDFCKFIQDKPTSDDIVYEIGDIDLSGEINVLDTTALQLYVSKNGDLTDAQLKLADLDGDGKIDVGDVTALQRIISKRKAL